MDNSSAMRAMYACETGQLGEMVGLNQKQICVQAAVCIRGECLHLYISTQVSKSICSGTSGVLAWIRPYLRSGHVDLTTLEHDLSALNPITSIELP